MKKFTTFSLLALATSAATAGFAHSASAAVTEETAFILNSLSFLLHGFLVMWMAAGFAMLEAGLVRTKNTAMQCTKNIAIYAIAGLLYWVIGYNLMYTGVDGGYFGTPTPWSAADAQITADGFVFNADESAYASASDWFFQMVFVATAASIVSGTLAERIKLWPFLIFTAVLTGVFYPIQGAWSWGGGWLSELGFKDFAGSTVVHSVGGWAALSGAIILGARRGKFNKDGSVNPMPGSNLTLATIGTFILWLGWFGFNGGSELAMGSASAVADIAKIYVNTNMAAAAGVVVAMIMTTIMYKKVDLTMALNGALGGLVGITAEPLAPSVGMSVFVGAVAAVLVVLVVPLLDKLKIDDVVGAIPVHLVGGIWGTIAVALSNPDATFVHQITGIVAVGVFMLVVSTILWFVLKIVMGLRPSEEDEDIGLDRAECGLEAYPEFGRGSQTI